MGISVAPVRISVRLPVSQPRKSNANDAGSSVSGKWTRAACTSGRRIFMAGRLLA
jgi:hypothetical protein